LSQSHYSGGYETYSSFICLNNGQEGNYQTCYTWKGVHIYVPTEHLSSVTYPVLAKSVPLCRVVG